MKKVTTGQISATSAKLTSQNASTTNASSGEAETDILEERIYDMKKQMRTMQQDLNSKRKQWSDMDTWTTHLKQKSLGGAAAASNVMRRRIAVKEPTQASSQAGGDFDFGRRNSKIGTDIMALRATAAMIGAIRQRNESPPAAAASPGLSRVGSKDGKRATASTIGQRRSSSVGLNDARPTRLFEEIRRAMQSEEGPLLSSKESVSTLGLLGKRISTTTGDALSGQPVHIPTRKLYRGSSMQPDAHASPETAAEALSHGAEIQADLPLQIGVRNGIDRAARHSAALARKSFTVPRPSDARRAVAPSGSTSSRGPLKDASDLPPEPPIGAQSSSPKAPSPPVSRQGPLP
eukprot:CAMPEP_0183590904 /NCGR_PEP_ID=MMETSP0371-20130417/165298_1 /TAXON_ID=268820 /ORGANISM="Peridinium aciculiferum, Strain PAER-2" /LENGTH=347 /DNA_ID=CAMNT_0025802337 /DNA_START=24 /DNA_END=1064 /DNA_ORIENTATION=-